MKIGTSVQAILMVFLNHLKCCNTGITDEKGLWSMPLKLAEVAWSKTIGSGIW
jgi:hypothetical protein